MESYAETGSVLLNWQKQRSGPAFPSFYSGQPTNKRIKGKEGMKEREKEGGSTT